MNYAKCIEIYVGRTVDFETEVKCIQTDVWTIKEWMITNKPQPTIEQLEALQPQVEIQENNERLRTKITELDGKRSRAFFEPSEKEAGLTWLEYYNQEITKLRNKLI